MSAKYAALVFVLIFIPGSDADPCTNGFNFITLKREEFRGTNCDGKNVHSRTSDARLREGWYRVKGQNGYQELASQSPQLYSCSTFNPVWMNGSHPTYIDGIVNRTVCIVTSKTTCLNPQVIQVRNCSVYTAYRLVATSYTDSAYCFGLNKPCPPFDPCEEYFRKDNIYDDGFRSPHCKLKKQKCDDKLQDGWYKMMDYSWRRPLSIPTKPQLPNSCGTKFPLWMNGTNPAKNDGIVSGVICRTGSCDRSFPIRLKNCSNFIAYKLKQTPQCPERYCLDDESKCRLHSNTVTKNSWSSSNKEHKILTYEFSPRDIVLIVLAIILLIIVIIGGSIYACKIFRKKNLSIRQQKTQEAQEIKTNKEPQNNISASRRRQENVDMEC